MKFSLSTIFTATKAFKLFFLDREVIYVGEEKAIDRGNLYYFKYLDDDSDDDEFRVCLYPEEIIEEIQIEQIESE